MRVPMTENRDWGMSGGTESSVNLFTLYGMEHCTKANAVNESARPEMQRKYIEEYIAGGKNFEHDWYGVR